MATCARSAPTDQVSRSAYPDGMLSIGSIVIRVDDLPRMVAFWSAALAYVPRGEHDSDDFVLLRPRDGRGPNVSLDAVRAPRSIPPKLHLDLYAGDRKTEVARLEALGATRLPWHYDPGDDFVVLADPDGNEFCVIQSPYTQE